MSTYVVASKCLMQVIARNSELIDLQEYCSSPIKNCSLPYKLLKISLHELTHARVF